MGHAWSHSLLRGGLPKTCSFDRALTLFFFFFFSCSRLVRGEPPSACRAFMNNRFSTPPKTGCLVVITTGVPTPPIVGRGQVNLQVFVIMQLLQDSYRNSGCAVLFWCLRRLFFQCFEGMKAYKDAAGNVRLFRPNLNVQRMNRSLARLRFPVVDEAALIQLLRFGEGCFLMV